MVGQVGLPLRQVYAASKLTMPPAMVWPGTAGLGLTLTVAVLTMQLCTCSTAMSHDTLG